MQLANKCISKTIFILIHVLCIETPDIVICVQKIQNTLPGLSALNLIMTYPFAGTLTVSLMGGSMRFRSGMFPLIQDGSDHVALEHCSFRHRISGLGPVELPVWGSVGG